MKRNLSIILIVGGTVLGCGTSKKVSTTTSESISTDSITQIDTVRVDTFKVPADTVRVAVPVPMIQYIDGQRIGSSNGRASVFVQRIRDTIYFTATCDSLQQLVLSRDRQISRYESNQRSQQQTITKSMPERWLLWGFGVIAGIIIIISVIDQLKKPISWLRNLLQNRR